MDAWHDRRLAELRARAPAPRKKQKPFVIADLAAAAEAFTAMSCPKAMVYVWLVHKARVSGQRTVLACSKALAKYGVSRGVKGRALEELEAAGRISVERRGRKNPLVTLL